MINNQSVHLAVFSRLRFGSIVLSLSELSDTSPYVWSVSSDDAAAAPADTVRTFPDVLPFANDEPAALPRSNMRTTQHHCNIYYSTCYFSIFIKLHWTQANYTEALT